MSDEDVSKSSERYYELFVVQKPLVKVRARKLARLLACPLCKKVCKDAITINRCNHTFCDKCILQKVEAVGGLKCCPDCDEDLSSYNPDQYLRPDETLRSIIKNMLGNMEIDETMENPHQLVTGDLTTRMNQMKTKAILRKKRSTRKPRKFPSTQENGKIKVESENNIGEESTKILISGKETPDEIDEKNLENEAVCLDELQSIWFHLSPEKSKKKHSYPEFAGSYIHVKNANMSMPVSALHKYLVMKLNLQNEDEVEVCCFGEPLIKALTLRDTYGIWIECVSQAPPSHYHHINPKSLSAKKLVMELTYRKNIKGEAHPLTLNIRD